MAMLALSKMSCHLFRCLLLGAVAWCLQPTSVPAEEGGANTAVTPSVQPGNGEFIRYDDSDPENSKLQTSVVRYVRGDQIVDLVGAVHLADPGYFDSLNAQLAQYDVVLYEMVGGEFATRDERSAEVDPEIAQVQMVHGLIHRVLGMEYQTEGIDYDQPNFIHADVNWEQYGALMTARDQSLATLFQRALAMAQSGEGPAILRDEAVADQTMKGLMAGLTTGNTAKLKRALAPFLGEAESFITGIEGEDGTVIVTERNKVVMGILDREMKRGHRNIAIFYGAGHFVDLEKRLLASGFQQQTGVWLTAWDISEAAPGQGVNLWQEIFSDPELMQGIMSSVQEMLRGLQEGGVLEPATPGQ
ncbi:MAG: hypothetical protein KDN20_00920 [Verrucomicrobiae bacterium]|nr:hypothetical protein [Verrucomicrobiae bacterium]